MPLAAVFGRRDGMGDAERLVTSVTYGGEALACAAGKAGPERAVTAMESVDVDAQPPTSGVARTVGEVGDQAQHVHGGPIQRDLVNHGPARPRDGAQALGCCSRSERVLAVGQGAGGKIDVADGPVVLDADCPAHRWRGLLVPGLPPGTRDALAATVLLAFAPQEVVGVSFQMSFAAVLALIRTPTSTDDAVAPNQTRAHLGDIAENVYRSAGRACSHEP